jgi:hypothetical protein
MASDPVPPLLGSATLEPGWLETTAPAALLPADDGEANPEPASNSAPRPIPLRPAFAGPDPELEIEGGGATTWFASCVPLRGSAPPLLLLVPVSVGGGATMAAPRAGADEDERERASVSRDCPVEGGGAIALDTSAAPLLRGLPVVELTPAVGGGGTMFAVSEVPVALPKLFD